jgi:excisionase family DNA binding protein
MSEVTVVTASLEDVRRIVREEIAATRQEWLTTQQASEYTGLAVGTIRNLVSQGSLPRHGERYLGLRFRRSELDEYLVTRRGSGQS